MSRGHNISKCHACFKEFVCGDCILSVCPECSAKLIKELKIECPEHGLQTAKPTRVFGIKLSCGCELDDAGGYGWVRNRHKEDNGKRVKHRVD
jgi:hypothetical protein